MYVYDVHLGCTYRKQNGENRTKTTKKEYSTIHMYSHVSVHTEAVHLNVCLFFQPEQESRDDSSNLAVEEKQKL